MKFTKTSEKLPEFGKEVLIRYKKYGDTIGYYVCVLCYKSLKDKTLIFEEAGGEQYTYWFADEVDGWMYTSEFDSIE